MLVVVAAACMNNLFFYSIVWIIDICTFLSHWRQTATTIWQFSHSFLGLLWQVFRWCSMVANSQLWWARELDIHIKASRAVVCRSSWRRANQHTRAQGGKGRCSWSVGWKFYFGGSKHQRQVNTKLAQLQTNTLEQRPRVKRACGTGLYRLGLIAVDELQVCWFAEWEQVWSESREMSQTW